MLSIEKILLADFKQLATDRNMLDNTRNPIQKRDTKTWVKSRGSKKTISNEDKTLAKRLKYEFLLYQTRCPEAKDFFWSHIPENLSMACW